MYTSARKNTATITAIPFSSIQNVDAVNNTVSVNVLTSESGGILIGGTYVGLQTNATAADVYLYIIGT